MPKTKEFLRMSQDKLGGLFGPAGGCPLGRGEREGELRMRGWNSHLQTLDLNSKGRESDNLVLILVA